MKKEFLKILGDDLKVSKIKEFDTADDGAVKFKAYFNKGENANGIHKLVSVNVSKKNPQMAEFVLEPFYVAHVLETSKHSKIKDVTNWFISEIDKTVKASKVIYCSSVNGQVGGH